MCKEKTLDCKAFLLYTVKVVFMEDKIRQGNLYEFYGDLLNPHQKKIYEDYVLNDLSLGEIAENENITRQGVYDLVKRTSTIMEHYEDKLHVMKRFFSIREKLLKMKDLLDKDVVERKLLINLIDEIDGEL